MLIIKCARDEFNTEEIRRGTLIYARHKTWQEAEMGFAVESDRDRVIVQYPPKVANVTNHFILPVGEVAAGEWEIRWSNDMRTIYEYAGEKANEFEPVDF